MTPIKKTTMQDVADAAGVSKMTVSYALRYHPCISPQTAERVRTIARDLGYTVNPLVSALCSEVRARHKHKSPLVVAYLNLLHKSGSLLDSSFGVQAEYLKGATDRCQELGFKLELFEPISQDMPGKRLAQILQYRNINGVITTGALPYDFEWDTFFGISIGPQTLPPLFNKITFSHYQSMRETLVRLRSMGYERIAIALNERWGVTEYYRAAIALYQQEIPRKQAIPPIARTSFSKNSDSFRHWLRKYTPDVFVDASASGFYEKIQQLGLSIPQDISYVSLSLREDIHGIAGMNQNSKLIGATAVDLLVNEINVNRRGFPKTQSLTLISGVWQDGLSCPVKADRKDLIMP